MTRRRRYGERSLAGVRARSLRVEQLEDRRLLAGAPGDFNESGTVDTADYTLWQDALESGMPLANDGQLGDLPPVTVPVVKLLFAAPLGQPLHFVEA